MLPFKVWCGNEFQVNSGRGGLWVGGSVGMVGGRWVGGTVGGTVGPAAAGVE